MAWLGSWVALSLLSPLCFWVSVAESERTRELEASSPKKTLVHEFFLPRCWPLLFRPALGCPQVPRSHPTCNQDQIELSTATVPVSCPALPLLSLLALSTPCRRINVGSRFQAEIPPMRDRALAANDPHKADLVWQPWEELESSREKQRQGERRAWDSARR